MTLRHIKPLPLPYFQGLDKIEGREWSIGKKIDTHYASTTGGRTWHRVALALAARSRVDGSDALDWDIPYGLHVTPSLHLLLPGR